MVSAPGSVRGKRSIREICSERPQPRARERMRVCPECGGESSSRTDEGLLVCDLCGMTLQQVAVHASAAARAANCDLTAVEREQGEEKNEDDDMLVCRV